MIDIFDRSCNGLGKKKDEGEKDMVSGNGLGSNHKGKVDNVKKVYGRCQRYTVLLK